MPARHIAHVALLVRDYDEAIAWFSRCLDFRLLEDSAQTPSKRWVLMSPSDRGTALLLARAATPEQQAVVGNQGGGRVMFFLRTDNFRRDYQRMNVAGVRFVEPPRDEEYGRVVVFEDLYGNKWDLVESNQPS